MLLLCAAQSVTAQQLSSHPMPFVVMEYNCENLFDCRHDSLKEDYDFTPQGNHHWTFSRYWRKVNDIGKVIHQCGGSYERRHLPDIVALAEVENDSVITMLTRRSMLKNAGYKYVMTNSLDTRGVDVALLYNPLTFRLIAHHSLRMKLRKGQKPTRDILYAEGCIRNGDTLHIFVVHSPSRSGGETVSEPYRIAVAERLITAIDSVRGIYDNAKIIITGDFNDYYYNKQLRMLQAANMTNVSANAHGNIAKGTYKYGGEWKSLDHILLSAPLLDNVKDCHIHDPQWLLQQDYRHGYKPRRTFRGTFYQSGVSDHLPLVLNMMFAVALPTP